MERGTLNAKRGTSSAKTEEAVDLAPESTREDNIGVNLPGRLPSLFIAHGAPPLLDDASWVRELYDWAGRLPGPSSILMLSAHWEQRPVTIGATRTLPLIYDFYGFPSHYYEQQYAAPGAPELAARVRSILAGTHPTAEAPERGLDHGAYVPLVAMYPEADVPVLQVSLPSENPEELFSLGRALAPLRDEGVLIVGSGFITHNLRTIDWQGTAPPPAWATEFDAWTAEALERGDVDALLDYETKAPGVRIALPTREHFVPLLVALGAATEGVAPSFPITGFWLGSL
ncbi:MAG: dioxygenase, partial [Thermoanaerobaculia bacterium]|nr:dioxygenase [Thermoanaerobaculia bacterium]